MLEKRWTSYLLQVHEIELMSVSRSYRDSLDLEKTKFVAVTRSTELYVLDDTALCQGKFTEFSYHSHAETGSGNPQRMPNVCV